MPAIFMALLIFAAACGSQNSTTATSSKTDTQQAGAGFVCGRTGPSLIPQPSGKPQLVYFFRDT